MLFRRDLSFGKWRRVYWLKCIDVSEEPDEPVIDSGILLNVHTIQPVYTVSPVSTQQSRLRCKTLKSHK